MPSWTAMDDLTTGELVTEADMDAIRGNIEYLLTPNSNVINRDHSGDYTTTSTSFVDIDATNLSLSVTTNGGPLFIFFQGAITNNQNTHYTAIDFVINGTSVSGGNGVFYTAQSNSTVGACMWLEESLAAAAQTIKVQWRMENAATTATLHNNGEYVTFGAIEL